MTDVRTPDRPVLLVMAKAPVPGLAKTRLALFLGTVGAAEVAAAALLDTLEVVRELGGPSVVALTGDLGQSARREELSRALAYHHVINQRGDDLANRLAMAHADAAQLTGSTGVVQIGMDTPQLTAELLLGASSAIGELDGADAALGPATDGGWWCLAVRDAALAMCLASVPMSRADTGRRTRTALQRAGARVSRLPELGDVDTLEDAYAVAQLIPKSWFAAAVQERAGQLSVMPR